MDDLKTSAKTDNAALRTTIEGMKVLLTEKDTKIRELEERIDDLEQYTRKEDIIITGLTIERSHAEVVRGESPEDDNKGRNYVEEQVLEKLGEFGVKIKEEEISACHTLGKPDEKTKKQKVIIRFVSRKSKVRALIAAREKLYGTGVYISEHLTAKTGLLAKLARDKRRSGEIVKTWTRDCKVFIKMKDGAKKLIKTEADLADLKKTD